jgi:hypothetical protein
LVTFLARVLLFGAMGGDDGFERGASDVGSGLDEDLLHAVEEF